jgi:CubicO group peptidase (beta-lactamase class C family)
MKYARQKKDPRFKGAAALAGFLCLIFLLAAAQAPGGMKKKAGLPSVVPEVAGWSSAKLAEAEAFAKKINSAAVLVLYDGKVLVSWGDVAKKYKLHSIRKPLLSALYGVYWGRGKIRLDATLEELQIDDIPPALTRKEKRATVGDLLKSRSGVYHEAAAESRDMTAARPERGSHPPGTFFYYNNWDFNALGAIFEKAAGARIFEAFKSEIAEPIGMEDFSIQPGRGFANILFGGRRGHPRAVRLAGEQSGLCIPLRYGWGVSGPGRRDHPARRDDPECQAAEMIPGSGGSAG